MLIQLYKYLCTLFQRLFLSYLIFILSSPLSFIFIPPFLFPLIFLHFILFLIIFFFQLIYSIVCFHFRLKNSCLQVTSMVIEIHTNDENEIRYNSLICYFFLIYMLTEMTFYLKSIQRDKTMNQQWLSVYFYLTPVNNF
jgi:hypothetical protein